MHTIQPFFFILKNIASFMWMNSAWFAGIVILKNIEGNVRNKYFFTEIIYYSDELTQVL